MCCSATLELKCIYTLSIRFCGTLNTLVHSFVWNTHSHCTGSYLAGEHSACNLVVVFWKEVKEGNDVILLTVRSALLEFFG